MAHLAKENESLRLAIQQVRSYQRARQRLGKPTEASTPPMNPSSSAAVQADELAAVLLAVHHRPVEFRAPHKSSPARIREEAARPVSTMCV